MTLGFALVTALALPRLARPSGACCSGSRSSLGLVLRLGALALRALGRRRRALVAVGARRLGAPDGGDALGRRARAARSPSCGRRAGAAARRRSSASRGSRPCSSRCCSRPGRISAILRLPHVHDLWTTGYGHVLLVKLGARRARARAGARRTTSSRCRGSRRRRRHAVARLSRSMLGESAVAMAVLLVAAMLVDSKPPPQPAPRRPAARAADRPLSAVRRRNVLADARPHALRGGGAARPRRARRRARGARTRSSRPATASMPPRIAALAGATACSARCPATCPSAGLGCKLVTLFPENTRPPDAPGGDRALRSRERARRSRSWTGRTSPRRAPPPRPRSPRACSRATDATRARDPRHRRAGASHARAFAASATGGDPRRRPRLREDEELAAEIGAAAGASFEDAVRGADVVAATTHSPSRSSARLARAGHARQLGRLDARRLRARPGDRRARRRHRRRVARLRVRAAARRRARARRASTATASRRARRARRRHAARAAPRPSEITLYKSVGVAVQDLAAAALVLAAARERGAGLEIELEEIHA